MPFMESILKWVLWVVTLNALLMEKDLRVPLLSTSNLLDKLLKMYLLFSLMKNNLIVKHQISKWMVLRRLKWEYGWIKETSQLQKKIFVIFIILKLRNQLPSVLDYYNKTILAKRLLFIFRLEIKIMKIDSVEMMFLE